MFRAEIGGGHAGKLIAREEPLAFHRQSACFNKVAKIIDGQMVDIGRFIPLNRQQSRYRHPAIPQ